MSEEKPTLTRLRLIDAPAGGVRHGLSSSDFGFKGFGEAYFSTIKKDMVKGWKRHKRMTLNLIVAAGEIDFIVCDNEGPVLSCVLTPDRAVDFQRLTVPPGFWVAFGGAGESLNVLLNIADIKHDPDEADMRPIEFFTWNWF